MLGLKRDKLYYVLAGAALGDLVWILAERGLPIFEISIVISMVISAASSYQNDFEESLAYLTAFILPFLSVQILLSAWYVAGIESRLEYNISSGFLLTTSFLSSVVLTVSFLLFSLFFRFIVEFHYAFK